MSSVDQGVLGGVPQPASWASWGLRLAAQADSNKLSYVHRYLSDDDDGVSEAIIPFAVQYIGILKVRTCL